MTDQIAIVCLGCGEEMRHSCGSQSGANRRKSAQIAEIAQDSKILDLNPSPNGARAYNQGYDQHFLRFWSIYPAKRDKRKAQIAWRKAVLRLTQIGANRADAIATILAGAERYRDEISNNQNLLVKYAEGWLNGDRWEDEPLPERLPPGIEPIAKPLTPEQISALADRIGEENDARRRALDPRNA